MRSTCPSSILLQQYLGDNRVTKTEDEGEVWVTFSGRGRRERLPPGTQPGGGRGKPPTCSRSLCRRWNTWWELSYCWMGELFWNILLLSIQDQFSSFNYIRKIIRTSDDIILYINIVSGSIPSPHDGLAARGVGRTLLLLDYQFVG